MADAQASHSPGLNPRDPNAPVCARAGTGTVIRYVGRHSAALLGAGGTERSGCARGRSIRAVEQTLQFVRASYLHDPSGFDPAVWSQNSPFLADLVFQISVIDKDGYLVASNISGTASRVYLGDREHFRVHKERRTDEVFISKPALGRVSGKWSIQLTRPIIAADGAFDGVVVVSLDPKYLTHFYLSVDLGHEGVALLVGLDGIIRARVAAVPTPIGQSLAGGVMQNLHRQAPSGHYLTVSRVDGVKRFYAYREVRGFPLIVAVGMGESEVMASYRQNQRSFIGVASLVTVVLSAVIVLIVRHQTRLDRTREELRRSQARHEEKSHPLDVTLQNMGQGSRAARHRRGDGDGACGCGNGGECRPPEDQRLSRQTGLAEAAWRQTAGDLSRPTDRCRSWSGAHKATIAP